MTRALVPNRALRGLLAEAGWTEDLLARRVNALAAETGLAMRLDRRSVTHWLAGRHPRPPVPALIAEAFRRRLDRAVSLADIGLALGMAGKDSSLSEDPAAVLTALARFDGDRRRRTSADVYSLAALAVPGWISAVSPLAAVPAPGMNGQRLEPGAVTVAEQMTRLFSDTDIAFGGGHARAALAAYLAFDIVPRLRAPGSPALRRRLLATATELTYLTAFMCFDDERHGLAQRYYRAALALAENNDPAAYAVTLRGLSVQARSLGHHQHAAHLAEAASRTAGLATGPARQAFFLGQVAVAAAATGNRHDAITALTAAERRLDRDGSPASSGRLPGSPAMGGYHPASLAHQQAAVRALLGDRKGAITALTESIRYRPPRERRSRAITHARLAELHLDQGHLDQAVTVWHAFLDDYPHLTSGRAATAWGILRSRLRPYQDHPGVRHLLARGVNPAQREAPSVVW